MPTSRNAQVSRPDYAPVPPTPLLEKDDRPKPCKTPRMSSHQTPRGSRISDCLFELLLPLLPHLPSGNLRLPSAMHDGKLKKFDSASLTASCENRRRRFLRGRKSSRSLSALRKADYQTKKAFSNRLRLALVKPSTPLDLLLQAASDEDQGIGGSLLRVALLSRAFDIRITEDNELSRNSLALLRCLWVSKYMVTINRH